VLILHIKHISLKDFRNYEHEEIELNKGVNIFYGQNAQGKTNIIESIYLLSTGKSHRSQKDNELIKWNKEDSKIKISYEKEKQDNTLEMYLKKNQRKSMKHNGVKLSKTGELLGNLITVIFSPDHMKIIKEGPAERRRFVDIILSQVKPGYFYNLSQYVKLVMQRNNLLMQAKSDSKIIDTIEIWDQQLIEYGTKVIKERIEFLKLIENYANEVHKSITNNKEDLKLIYKSSIEYKDKSEKQIKETFQSELEKFRAIDIKRGVTHKGPHRDDILFFINDMEVKTYGSQGQQRTTLLSLKISELQFMNYETDSYPILLLDDVFSELDTERQKFLMKFIKDIQTFITCTDVEYFKNLNLENHSLFNVIEGKIYKK
jgi:DNA replication and repair protein RecF